MSNPERPGTSKQASTAGNLGGDQQKTENGEVPSASNENIKTQIQGKENVDLIDVVNDLQNKLIATGHTLDINLPQIIVVGSQSAGKSSVLESFVEKEFLPRGKGTVTRRPTLVQMIPNPYEEYVVFAHKPDLKFYNFEDVRKEIESETQKNPGPTGFSSDPISLKIFSPRALKLTVVDLPGLIKVVEDDKDHGNIKKVRDMVLHYIRPEETLILAVTPATQDLLTSDALEIAKEVDTKRERTICVMTKLDNLSDGTDCREVFENPKMRFSKGCVGVVNRSQKEIEEGKDFQYILQKEKDFFANHPAYRHMKDVMGVPYLKSMLQKALRLRIKQFLPQVRNDVSMKLAENKKKIANFLKRMGDTIGVSHPFTKQYYVIKLIQNFIEDFNIQVMGNSELIDINKFSAGALINYKLCTEVRRLLSLTLVPSDSQTAFIIANQMGLRTSISIPAPALDALNRILLEQYKGPMEESVNCIKRVLDAAITESAKKMDPYNSLKNEVLFQIRQCLDIETERTIDRLIAHIEANMYYINFNYPDFDISVCEPVAPPVGPIKLWENASTEDDLVVESNEEHANGLSIPSRDRMVEILGQNESNKNNVKYCQTLLMKNLEQVQKQMGDVAIKYIVFFLVKKLLDYIKGELLPMLMSSSNIASLTEDCEADFRWKEETEATCDMLQEALNAIKDF